MTPRTRFSEKAVWPGPNGIRVVRGYRRRRMSLTEALAYVAKGYHRAWRMESVGCHYTRMTTPGAVISTTTGPDGVGYVAVYRYERLGVVPTFLHAVALVDAEVSPSGRPAPESAP